MASPFIKKYSIAIALFLLCFVLLVSHTLYVAKSIQYPEQDEHAYLGLALKYYDILKHPNLLSFQQILLVSEVRQPLYGLLLTIPLFIFGLGNLYTMSLWINWIFYTITIIAIYFLGIEFLSKKSSLLASFIFATYGFPLFYLHFTYSETLTTMFVVLSLLYLKKTILFTSLKNTILFSIYFCLGMLTRWVVGFFVLGSLTTIFIQSVTVQLRKKTRSIKPLLKNYSVMILIAVVLPAVLFYIPSFKFMKAYFYGNVDNANWWVKYVNPDLPNFTDVFSVHSTMFYFNILSQQTIYFFTLFAIGMLIALYNFKKYAFLSIGFIFSYCIFTFGSVLKFDRYIVPIYPLMALLSAITFDYIKNKKILNVTIIFIIVLGISNFLGASWGIGPLGFQGLKDIVLPKFIHHPRRAYVTTMVWPPRPQELNASTIITTIEKDFTASRLPNILSTFNYHPFDNALGSINAYEKINKFNLVYIMGKDYQGIFNSINVADYILIKDAKYIDKGFDDPTSTVYIYGIGVIKFYSALSVNHNKLPKAFSLIGSYPIAIDKTNVLLYKKTRPMTQDEWNQFILTFIQTNPTDTQEIQNSFASLSIDE